MERGGETKRELSLTTTTINTRYCHNRHVKIEKYTRFHKLTFANPPHDKKGKGRSNNPCLTSPVGQSTFLFSSETNSTADTTRRWRAEEVMGERERGKRAEEDPNVGGGRTNSKPPTERGRENCCFPSHQTQIDKHATHFPTLTYTHSHPTSPPPRRPS